MIRTDVSVNTHNHLSKLYVQFESSSTRSGAQHLLCAKAILCEHIQEKLILPNLALVSSPMVRLTRGQEGKSTWSKLLASLLPHIYSHKPLPSSDPAVKSLHFRSQPKACVKFGQIWKVL